MDFPQELRLTSKDFKAMRHLLRLLKARLYNIPGSLIEFWLIL
jgi:hypothetical protein